MCTCGPQKPYKVQTTIRTSQDVLSFSELTERTGKHVDKALREYIKHIHKMSVRISRKKWIADFYANGRKGRHIITITLPFIDSNAKEEAAEVEKELKQTAREESFKPSSKLNDNFSSLQMFFEYCELHLAKTTAGT